MTNPGKIDRTADTSAEITEDHLERARLLIGYDEASSQRQQFTVASEDSIRAFAMSFGSDNPLYCDPDYARNTRWGGLVAPGTMAVSMGAPLRGDPRPDHIARAKRHLFQGIHQLHSGNQWEWYGPIRPGDRLYRFGGQESLEVKKSEFAGRSVIRVQRDVVMNQNAEIVCIYRPLMVLSERKTAAKRGKYKDIEPAFYTDEDLAEIDAIYEAEQVRGAEPRIWEEVAIGDSLGVMAKGPLTFSDIIALHAGGFGMVEFGPSTSRIRYKRRQKMPRAYTKNKLGIPEIVMRMHWDDDWAREIGSPMAYDYGFQRELWLYHYLGDWCSDDGIVLRMAGQMRMFNFHGDTQTITGEVVDKQLENGRATVDVKVRFTSQRGDITMEATATLGLPSREHGQTEYPVAPAELAERAKSFLARHHELSGSRDSGAQHVE